MKRTRLSMLRNPNPRRVRSPGTNPTPSSAMREQLDALGRPHQAHLDRPRARVPNGVGQRLLRNAEQAELHVGIERVEAVSSTEGHGDLMVTLDVGAVTSQSRRQAQVLQHTGMQLVRQILDGDCGGGCPALGAHLNHLFELRLGA